MSTQQNYIYLDRELSWLKFNRRVLELASLSSTPLFERLRFLGIYCNNLDEYFMKRVGGLKRQVKAGITESNQYGRTPVEQILYIREQLKPDIETLHNVFYSELLPNLEQQGFYFRVYAELSEEQKNTASKYFHKNIFPLLTPLGVDAGRPFPIISNLSTNLACAIREPGKEEMHFARVKINHLREQWVCCSNLNSTEQVYISVKSLIAQHLTDLFPGMQIESSCIFRVTRNAGIDLAVDDDAEDLLEMVEEELRQRKFSEVVRLEFAGTPDPWIKEFLCTNLEVQDFDIFYTPSYIISYASFISLIERAPKALLFKPHRSQMPLELQEDPDFFSLLKTQDLLVYHPYQSFTHSVEKFLFYASHDPHVRSIKMTLYRIGDVNQLMPLLINAAEMGKNVVCLVEVKARFDEERNIEWANTLEEAGIHVVYGIPGLKTHAKTVVVVRQEEQVLRAYAHIGTGNYNATTAKLYTDLGLFTADTEITKDILDFFNYLTGHSLKQKYSKILVAPAELESTWIDLIQQEMIHAQAGRQARIIVQMNNLEDAHIINALYEASSAGVQVDLIIRGICCLLPKLEGVSKNINVRSILGRFLEHTRLIYFSRGMEDPLKGSYFISSADWMSRNMHRRVELAVPISAANDKKKCWNVLKHLMSDQIIYWAMDSNGEYILKNQNNSQLSDVQEIFATKFDYQASGI